MPLTSVMSLFFPIPAIHKMVEEDEVESWTLPLDVKFFDCVGVRQSYPCQDNDQQSDWGFALGGVGGFSLSGNWKIL